MNSVGGVTSGVVAEEIPRFITLNFWQKADKMPGKRFSSIIGFLVPTELEGRKQRQ